MKTTRLHPSSDRPTVQPSDRRTVLLRLLPLALAALAFLLLPLALFGQADPAAAVPAPAGGLVLPPEAQNFILEILAGLMVKYPWVATIVGLMGTMRLWAKPLFSAIHALVEVTPSKVDDGLWASAYRFFTENPLGRFLAYLLDWLASVKITPTAARQPSDGPTV